MRFAVGSWIAMGPGARAVNPFANVGATDESALKKANPG